MFLGTGRRNPLRALNTFSVTSLRFSCFDLLLQACEAPWPLLFRSVTQRLTPARWCFPPPSWSSSSPCGSAAAAPCPCWPSWAYRKAEHWDASCFVFCWNGFQSMLVFYPSLRVGVDSDQDASVSNRSSKLQLLNLFFSTCIVELQMETN